MKNSELLEKVFKQIDELSPKLVSNKVELTDKEIRNKVRELASSDVELGIPLGYDDYVDFQEECREQGFEATQELFDFYKECLAGLAGGYKLQKEGLEDEVKFPHLGIMNLDLEDAFETSDKEYWVNHYNKDKFLTYIHANIQTYSDLDNFNVEDYAEEVDQYINKLRNEMTQGDVIIEDVEKHNDPLEESKNKSKYFVAYKGIGNLSDAFFNLDKAIEYCKSTDGLYVIEDRPGYEEELLAWDPKWDTQTVIEDIEKHDELSREQVYDLIDLIKYLDKLPEKDRYDYHEKIFSPANFEEIKTIIPNLDDVTHEKAIQELQDAVYNLKPGDSVDIGYSKYLDIYAGSEIGMISRANLLNGYNEYFQTLSLRNYYNTLKYLIDNRYNDVINRNGKAKYIKIMHMKNIPEREIILEDIEKHDTLNPKLFDGEELKPEVKEAIEKIAYEFVRGLNEDGIRFTLKDIVLLGSNVSYNYTKDSDLDIHLIADSSGLECPDDLYPLLYSAYRSIFNKNYDITIKGIPAEIYVEMDKPQARSNGIYSLNDGWIKKPEQTAIPDLDEEAFDKLFNEWEDKYFELISNKKLEEKKDHLDVELSDKQYDTYGIRFIIEDGNDQELLATANPYEVYYFVINNIKQVQYVLVSELMDETYEHGWSTYCIWWAGDPINDLVQKLAYYAGLDPDRLSDEIILEALHPETDLGWNGDGKRHPVDADTFTTAKAGDTIKVHILDELPDLEYVIYDGSYLDDEARKESPWHPDEAMRSEPTKESRQDFIEKLEGLIRGKVKKAMADLVKNNYKDNFNYYCGGTGSLVVPIAISLPAARNQKIPDILEQNDPDKDISIE